MRIRGIRKKMYCLTGDKPWLDRRALQLRCSLDEVRKLLDGGKRTK